MKRMVLFGTIISAFILLMVSSVSAVEYRTVIEYNTAEIISQIENENINDIPEEWISIFQKIKLNVFDLKTTSDITILSEKITELLSTIQNTPEPTCIRLVFRFIFRVLFAIVGAILGAALSHIFVLIIKIMLLKIRVMLLKIMIIPSILTAKIILILLKLIISPITWRTRSIF